YGNAISDGMFIEAIDILDGKAELTPKNATAKSTIINHVVNFPEGKYNDGKITVNKTVLINGTAGKVTDTFYFALFTDAARTMPADTPVMELKLKDESSGLVTFTDLPYGDYYLAETDKDGNPVDSSYEYTVTIEESHCKITEENRTESRTVVNSKTETPSTEPGGTPGKTPSSGKLTVTTSAKTGDNNNIWLYVALMLAAMFVGAGYVIYRRKRKKA
ncbi:MAG: LPXTG cell wall anchor domain-containing protein, partial [Blautia sp.]|nr:LPXTG cell wall anchor domain-containing protein [Blautia sp.]